MVLKLKNIKYLIGSVLMFIVLSGCGGGGGGTTPASPPESDTTKTAYFIDSAVQGVSYTCGDISGITNSDGKFTYDSTKCSSGVVFKLGGLSLGSIAPNSINADDKLTIQDLVGVERTNLTDATVLKIATLLQSLDNDGNATNGIKIDVNVSTLTGIITSISDINSSITSLGKIVKTESEVKAHLETVTSSIGVVFDRAPASFSFTPHTGLSLDTEITSNQIKITGINTATSISVSSGSYYKINNGNWTAQNGTIFNDDNVMVKHTTINDFNQTKTTTLTIGTLSGTFVTTTKVADIIPDSFSFTPQTGLPLDTEITSNKIKITGINTATSISVSSGSYYKINNGNWTAQNGTIFNDDNVTIQHRTINGFNQTKTTTLTIGTISSTFSSTTKAASNIPDDFNFERNTSVNPSTLVTSNTIQIKGIDQNISISVSGGDYKINNGNWMTSSGTVAKDDNVTLRHTSSSSYDINTTTVLTAGTVSKTFISTTRKANTIPNSFSFDNNLSVPLNSIITSNIVTISGLEANANISIINGNYKINSGNWATTNGTISNGQSVQVSHTSHINFETNTTTILTIGGVTRQFISKTIVGDSTPNPFAFVDQSDVSKKTYIESNDVNISGINTPTTISIVGGYYSINGGSWTNVNGTISNGQKVKVRHLSSAYKTTQTDTNLTVGGVSDIFSSTTDASAIIFSGHLLIGHGVKGVQYSCKDTTRTTDINGTFTYSIDECNGSPIVFKLKNLILGSLDSTTNYDDKNVTIQEILGISKSVINNQTVSKTAILLTSLDNDNDLSNGIEINANTLGYISLIGNISTIPDANITTEIVARGKVVKSKFDALKYLLEGTKSMGISTTELVTYPENGATNIGTYPIFKVAFGEKMNISTVTDGANIKIKTNDQFSKKDYNDTLMMAVYKEPNVVLSADVNLTITITSGIKNSKGQSITEYKVSFIPTAKNIQPKLKTGQIGLSYDESGNSVSDGLIKDDSYYVASGTDRNIGESRIFTRDENETVIDTKTSLQWEDGDHVKAPLMNYLDAKSYCGNLTLSGYDNWRLPTIKEFSLIADKGRMNPSIFDTFTKVNHTIGVDAYWSSDNEDFENNTTSAVRFDNGIDGFGELNINSTLNARCVRTKIATVYGEYIRDSINGIVVDTSSGYMWQDNVSYNDSSFKWIDSTSSFGNPSAIKVCENLVLGGYSDWRVPNYNELLNLVDKDNYDKTSSTVIYTPAVFENKINGWYWSSTSNISEKNQAWIINFGNGQQSDVGSKSTNSYTRCVRGK
jgi:hypothetical protein